VKDNPGNKLVSAQVIVKTERQNTSLIHDKLNMPTNEKSTPEHSSVTYLTNIFSKNGFSVGPFVGISFSITADNAVFNKFLGASILTEDNKLNFFNKNIKIGKELRNESLPESLRSYVEAIVLPLPPDFGPGNY
jgi:hypothetical protein